MEQLELPRVMAEGNPSSAKLECSILTEQLGMVSATIVVAGVLTARAVISGMIELAKKHVAFVNFSFEGVSQQAAWTSNIETLLVLHERRRHATEGSAALR